MIEDSVRVIGNVHLGDNVSIAGPSELMAKHSQIVIGGGCDIAGFVTITTADSHMRCLELSREIRRCEIVLEDHVFVGQGVIILGGTHVGHHSVIGAGVVLSGQKIPPWSRVRGPAPVIEEGFYDRQDRV